MTTTTTLTAEVLEPPAVDYAKPILTQVGALGDSYDGWVHGALSPNAERVKREHDEPVKWSGSVRMFEWDWLEVMSHIPWWIVPLVWIPASAAFFAVGIVEFGQSVPVSIGLGALGIFTFTFIEYALHRWLFHYKPSSAFGRKLHFLLHGVHHLDPWDGTRLVMPPLLAAILAAVVFGLVVLITGLAPAFPLMGGILLGYIGYDLIHYYTHHAKPKTRVGKFLKAYHLAHHHKIWEGLYGVSNPFWDVVFRTGRPGKKLA